MGSKIYKIATYLPNQILSNVDLAKMFNRWDPDKIEAKIGIRERHIAAQGETAGDLAFLAAKSVLDNYDITKIDILILCTQSPDYFLPATACVLQDRLGLPTTVGAYDFNQGCSGYIYGLAMAKAFITAGMADAVLLLTAETYSKHIHPKDLANRAIFGDGATATIIEHAKEEKIFQFILGTDGSGINNLIVRNGCFRSSYQERPQEKTNDAGDIFTDNHLFMNGSDIFSFTIESVPNAINACLLKNNMKLEEIDYFIFHQANLYMIEYLRKKIRIPREKFYANILFTGNTVSNTIPIALSDTLNQGFAIKGEKILLCGFGVGYSWGAVVIEI